MKRKRETKVFHKAIDGEATKSETRMLKRTLGKDDEARAEFRKMKRMVKVTEKIKADTPKGFKGRVLKGLRSTPPSKG